MKESKRKAEIEALEQVSPTFIASDYIMRQINRCRQRHAAASASPFSSSAQPAPAHAADELEPAEDVEMQIAGPRLEPFPSLQTLLHAEPAANFLSTGAACDQRASMPFMSCS